MKLFVCPDQQSRLVDVCKLWSMLAQSTWAGLNSAPKELSIPVIALSWCLKLHHNFENLLWKWKSTTPQQIVWAYQQLPCPVASGLMYDCNCCVTTTTAVSQQKKLTQLGTGTYLCTLWMFHSDFFTCVGWQHALSGEHIEINLDSVCSLWDHALDECSMNFNLAWDHSLGECAIFQEIFWFNPARFSD